VAGLPDIQREVFLMSRIDRKKYKEIAVILNISTKAVEKRMHNALRSLQEQLGKI
jgi:RNA polymerase sigma-70 factor (ECF subfamily)